MECRPGRTPVLSLLKRVLHSLTLRSRTILCLGGGRAISRQSVQGYVTWLGEMKFSPSTINQRLAAIRKLATEAQRCGYVDSETAQAIVTVAGVSQKGRRLGRWLAWEEARTLLQAPNPHSGMRDRALLGVLVTCALRRGELSRMNCEHLAIRDGCRAVLKSRTNSVRCELSVLKDRTTISSCT